jgi:hypothetical protein
VRNMEWGCKPLMHGTQLHTITRMCLQVESFVQSFRRV